MLGIQPLRNIVTEQLVSAKVVATLLKIFHTWCDLYAKFINERFCNDERVSISATIHKIKFPTFKDVDKEKYEKSEEKVKKSHEHAHLQRIIELAGQRAYSLETLFTFELIDDNYLFDEQGLLKKKEMKLLWHIIL